MYYILTCQVLGGKYSRWIVILQEFELEFAKPSFKKSLIFTDLMCDLPHITEDTHPFDSFPDESLFLISMSEPWYGDLILYLQTQRFHPNEIRDKHHHIRHHAKYYLIINDTLYHCGIDAILQRFLTHEEDEVVLNNYHFVAFDDHISGMATAQKNLCDLYFWPSIFKYCLEVIKKCLP